MLEVLLLIMLTVALPLVLARIAYLTQQGRLRPGGDGGCAADGGGGLWLRERVARGNFC